jgi:hypothetical protein
MAIATKTKTKTKIAAIILKKQAQKMQRKM